MRHFLESAGTRDDAKITAASLNTTCGAELKSRCTNQADGFDDHQIAANVLRRFDITQRFREAERDGFQSSGRGILKTP